MRDLLHTPRRPLAYLVVATLLGGCASSPPRSETTPAPTRPGAEAATPQPADPLDVPASARRTADNIQLSGSELGTMWTFENPPLDYWQRTYNFRPGPDWLERVRLASVRYGEHCSASFVSATGLVMTNHHCARDCVEAVSTETRDYVVEGFYAAQRSQELLCPGLFLDQLIEIEDVTQRVQAVAAGGGSETAVAQAQEAEQERIEQQCESASKLECQVVSLFHGGQYKVYKYRRYSPVKLVFAPELDAGFFGGDPDNFTYPRYNLDVAFVRAYAQDENTPASTTNFFRWSASGAKEGDLVFVTGNPGSTSRQITVAQLMYERNFYHPFLIQFLTAQRDFLKSVAAQGPEQERRVRDQLFSIENSLKAYTGQAAGLMDSLLLGRKLRWEREFQQRVNASADLRARYGDVWDRLAAIQREKLRLAPIQNLFGLNFGLAAPHYQIARYLVGYVRASSLPEAERAEALHGVNVAQIEQMLRSPVPLQAAQGQQILLLQLGLAQRWLPADHPFIRAALRPGEAVDVATKRLIGESRIADVAFRQQILQGGVAAVQSATDPLVVLAREAESAYRSTAARWAELEAAEAVQEERLAKALFAVFGAQLPPDATFTLRISDGVVRRYPYNGTIAAPITTFHGLYARAAEFNNEGPWTLPKSFGERRSAVNMTTPFNFVTTNDITGGNSGSPMIDREGRVVGLAFDSNIEALPNEFVFRIDAGGRAIGVHSAGITEALRNVYRAEALLRELLGTAGSR